MLRTITSFICLIILASSNISAQYSWSSCSNYGKIDYGKYWVRNNIWGSGSAGAGSQCTYANSEKSWKAEAQHTDPGSVGKVKGYPQCVRGWSVGDGFLIQNTGLPVQVSALTKAKGRWKISTPTSSNGYYLCLWDLYLHSSASPGTGTANINLQVFQYIRDYTGYYGSSTFTNLPQTTIGGNTFRYKEGSIPQAATERVLTMFLMPYASTSAPSVMGSQDATIDLKGIIDFWKNAGKIPSNYYLSSIQTGFEIIQGGSFVTQDYWTAIQNEPDGGGTVTPPPSGGGTTTIYGDALASDWADWSWSSTRDFNNTNQIKSGSKSLRVNYTSTYGGLVLRKGTGVSASNLTDIRFWVYANSARTLTFYTSSQDGSGNSPSISFTTTANAWKEIVITKAQLGNPSTIKKITFQAGNFTGDVIYDDIRYTTSGSARTEEPTVVYRSSTPSELEQTIEVKAYPNPATDNLYIDIDQVEGNAQVMLLDMSGRLVQISEVTGQSSVSIPVGHLARGLYFLRVVEKDKVKTIKIELN
jgi:Secretion system C-terminal sorting domain